jgi:hypothetical protein
MEPFFSPRVHKCGKTLQNKASEDHIGTPIPPNNDSFYLHLRSMYRQSRPGTGTPHLTSGDIQLLMLQRIRLINMAHAWASLTLQGTSR